MHVLIYLSAINTRKIATATLSFIKFKFSYIIIVTFCIIILCLNIKNDRHDGHNGYVSRLVFQLQLGIISYNHCISIANVHY